MAFKQRLSYYRRVFSAYLTPATSQLTFWHDEPVVNESFQKDALGEYYMLFGSKADYGGAFDKAGVPLLDYRGKIGLQYNPIAIAQYGLGNYDLYRRTKDTERERKFLTAADWLVSNLQANPNGQWVWNHDFDWEYREPLKAPWYSALAQGQGISLLVRSHAETGEAAYLDAARRAFAAMMTPMDDGGVAFIDNAGKTWLEEYIVSPPTHILNGFIWASWGVHDYFLATGDRNAEDLFDRTVETLRMNLPIYDTGFWSLYEQSGTRLRMLASPFYHALHIVQLDVMHRLTGESIFRDYSVKWDEYRRSRLKRWRALGLKALFKLRHY